MSSYRINVKILAQLLLRASICFIILIVPLLLSTQFVSVQAGRSLVRRQCSTNSQCGGYKVCYYGTCAQPCWTNGDCGGGPCVNGVCGGGGSGSGGSSGSGSGSGGSGSGVGGSGSGSGSGGSGSGSGSGGSGSGTSGNSNGSSSGGNTQSLSGNPEPNSDDKEKPFFSRPIGKAVLAVSLLIIALFILIALYWCYRSRSKRNNNKNNHKTRGIPISMSKSRVTPAPSQPSILTESKSPEPFLEPEMMTPISPSSGNQLDNAGTASAAVTAQSARQPKRSYTIYGTQGASTSSVELSGTSNTYYPIGQQHHFMSSEHEPWE